MKGLSSNCYGNRCVIVFMFSLRVWGLHGLTLEEKSLWTFTIVLQKGRSVIQDCTQPTCQIPGDALRLGVNTKRGV